MSTSRSVLVCEAQVPFVHGGAELHVRGLVDELRRHGYRAERVSIPFKWYPKEELLSQAAAWRLVDLSESNGERIDTVIATKFPTYFVRHPNKVTWLFHQYRAIYDLCGTPFSEFDHSEADVRLRDKLIEHKRDMENTLFFGRRNLDTTVVPGSVAGVCGGLIDYNTSNVTNVGGNLTQALMETFLRSGFRYGSRKKVFFCSPLIASGLSSFPLGRLAPNAFDADTWGVSLQNYQSAQGDMLQIVVKRDGLDQFVTGFRVVR